MTTGANFYQCRVSESGRMLAERVIQLIPIESV